ncbi:RNA polymerase sigma factor [Thermodesulfobacteriota bacterium]
MGTRKEDHDILLVKECLNGSQNAWTAFYNRYVGLVRSVVKRHPWFLQHEIEDVSQSVFVSLMPALKTYDDAYSLPRFVCMITERTCIQEYRRRKAARRDGATEPIDHHDISGQGLRKIASNGSSQEQQLAQTQQLDLLRRALRSLGPRCRELIRLRFYEELPYNNIGRILGGTDNTLTVQVRRCLDDLRGRYKLFARRTTGKHH